MIRTLACLIPLLWAVPALAASPVNKSLLSGVAIDGYDPVAYFEQERAVEGSADFTHDWRGAEWRFVSAANRDRFAADPQRYAPQYGGYCAYGVARGSTVDVDPHAWRIVDGRLYLNYSKEIQERWEQDIPGYVEKADANWPGLVDD